MEMEQSFVLDTKNLQKQKLKNSMLTRQDRQLLFGFPGTVNQ